jgi:division/cell wall cluster transcriptional repressor MraZ
MSEPVGATVHKLDMAGRIKLTDDERAALGDSMVMSCGFDNNIVIYTSATWQRLVAGLERMPRLDPNVHDLKRLLLGPAVTCHVDGQGRVRLPEVLLKWAELGGGKLDAYVTPVDAGRWEAWELSKWHEFNKQRSPELKAIYSALLAAQGPQEEEAEGESA